MRINLRLRLRPRLHPPRTVWVNWADVIAAARTVGAVTTARPRNIRGAK
jgi:hypothetical protein